MFALAIAASCAHSQGNAPAPPDFVGLHMRPHPLARWLEEEKITVVSSPHDIGELKDVFDGNTATLLRSQQINPQLTTIQFDGTISVAATRVTMSHHVGRWRMEAMVWPRDGGNPTRYQIVPWAKAGDGEPSEVVFPRNLNVSEVTLTVERIGGDDYVHLCEWELLEETEGAA